MGVLGVDFAITEYVLGITLPVIIVPKLKKYEVSGNPYVAFLKAVCASVACEDPQQFDTIKISISSIELAETLLEQIEKFSSTLGSDAQKFSSNASNRLAEINKAIDRIKQDMNDIYDDIYSISSVDDIRDMISRIQIVCQKGIPSTDLADFEELKNTLNAFLSDITELTECKDDRAAFESKHDELITKYTQAEYDFDVVEIIEQVSIAIRESLDRRDIDWSTKYLSKPVESRVELLSWVDNTQLLPQYLSEGTKEK